EAKPAEAATPSTALAPSVPLPSAPIPAPTASSSASPTAPGATAAAPAQPAASETPTTPAATATAPPAEPPAKVSIVPPADQPVADRLKDLLAGKSVRFFDRKAERAAVEKFYGAREYAPLWTQSGKLTESGKGVIARLKDAASEGLNPADYAVPDFTAATAP